MITNKQQKEKEVATVSHKNRELTEVGKDGVLLWPRSLLKDDC